MYFAPVMVSVNHKKFIKQSIHLAEQAMANGDHPFGALLVKDDKVLLTSVNKAISSCDETHHAELLLVSIATRLYDYATLRECTLYSSTEPCAMCAGAIGWARIGQIVYACPTEVLAEIVGRKTFVLPCRKVLEHCMWQPEIIGPICGEEAADLHRRYWPTFDLQ